MLTDVCMHIVTNICIHIHMLKTSMRIHILTDMCVHINNAQGIRSLNPKPQTPNPQP